jgi:hypothetical protein
MTLRECNAVTQLSAEHRMAWINAVSTALIGGLWLWHLSLPLIEGKTYYFELPMWYRWAMHQPLLYVATVPATLGLAYSVLLQGSVFLRGCFLTLAPLGIFLLTVFGYSTQMSEVEIADGGAFWTALFVGLQMLSIWAGGAAGMVGRYVTLTTQREN